MKREHWLTVFNSKYFKHNGKELNNFVNPVFVISEAEMGIHYFDEDNNIIESVDKGCFYATSPFLQDMDIQKGDEIELEIGDSKLTLKFMGHFKNAVFGANNAANPMLLIDPADGFTISEEFREIGVMKAVGIDNGSIRRLYIVKYLAISVIGAIIGFFCSIPLGDMMIKTVSKNIVLGIESGSLMGLISSAAVVLIILLTEDRIDEAKQVVLANYEDTVLTVDSIEWK